PNWNMGKRITIDSSSGINKAFEFVEVQALFDIPKEKVKILIDSKSQIHAIVQDINNYYYIAASNPDMLLPINKFLNKIGLIIPYKSKEILDKTIKFELNHDIQKTYPFLNLFIKNYNKSLVEGTTVIFLNSYLQDLLLDKKISFSKLRKLLIDSYEILFLKSDNQVTINLKENSNNYSFKIKEDFLKLNNWKDIIFKMIIKYLKEKEILEEQW
ncbi:MAG: hypothetical protein WH035_01455, partial [Spirochaetota bacterium]